MTYFRYPAERAGKPTPKLGTLLQELEAEALDWGYITAFRFHPNRTEWDYQGTVLVDQDTYWEVKPLTFALYEPLRDTGYRRDSARLTVDFQGTRTRPDVYRHPHLFHTDDHCLNEWDGTFQTLLQEGDLRNFLQTWWLFLNHFASSHYIDYYRRFGPSRNPLPGPVINPARRIYQRDARGRFARAA